MSRLRPIQRLRFRRGAARHYDPASLHHYAYGHNTPARYIDPNGGENGYAHPPVCSRP